MQDFSSLPKDAWWAFFPAVSGFRVVSTDEFRGGAGAPTRVVHPDPGLRVVLAPNRPISAGWYQFNLRFPPEGLIDVQARFALAGDRVLSLRLPVLARNHFHAHFRLESALEHLTLIVTAPGYSTRQRSAALKKLACAANWRLPRDAASIFSGAMA